MDTFGGYVSLTIRKLHYADRSEWPVLVWTNGTTLQHGGLPRNVPSLSGPWRSSPIFFFFKKRDDHSKWFLKVIQNLFPMGRVGQPQQVVFHGLSFLRGEGRLGRPQQVVFPKCFPDETDGTTTAGTSGSQWFDFFHSPVMSKSIIHQC